MLVQNWLMYIYSYCWWTLWVLQLKCHWSDEKAATRSWVSAPWQCLFKVGSNSVISHFKNYLNVIKPLLPGSYSHVHVFVHRYVLWLFLISFIQCLLFLHTHTHTLQYGIKARLLGCASCLHQLQTLSKWEAKRGALFIGCGWGPGTAIYWATASYCEPRVKQEGRGGEEERGRTRK